MTRVPWGGAANGLLTRGCPHLVSWGGSSHLLGSLLHPLPGLLPASLSWWLPSPPQRLQPPFRRQLWLGHRPLRALGPRSLSDSALTSASRVDPHIPPALPRPGLAGAHGPLPTFPSPAESPRLERCQTPHPGLCSRGARLEPAPFPRTPVGGPLLHPPAEDGQSCWVLVPRPRRGTGRLEVGVGGGAGAQAGPTRTQGRPCSAGQLRSRAGASRALCSQGARNLESH